MFNLDELAQNVALFRDGSLSFAEFHKWFEENDSEAVDPKLRAAADAVEAAISAYFYDGIGESALRQELADAVLPFSQPVQVYTRAVSFVHGKPSIRASVATPSVQLRRAVLSA